MHTRAIYRILCVGLFFLVLPSQLQAGSPTKCQERLDKAKGEIRLEEKIKQLKRAAKRCKEYAPLYIYAADLLVENQVLADEDWFELALHYYETAVQAEPMNVEARWKIATAWTLLGEYERALPHYQSLAEQKAEPDAGLPGREVAAVHAATCKLLASLPHRSPVDLTEPARKAAGRIDVSDTALSKRAEGAWLRDWVCAVALAGGDGSEAAARSHVAGCQLYDWKQRPYVQNRMKRVEELSGLVTDLATVMVKYSLLVEVDSLLDEYSVRPGTDWPGAHSGGTIEERFAAKTPDSLRSCTFSEGLRAVHVWRTPDLCGPWHCHVALVAAEGKESQELDFDIEVKQVADTVHILLPRIEGHFVERSRLVLHIDGRKLDVIDWEVFSTGNPRLQKSLRGRLWLADSYELMEGPLAILNLDLYLWLQWFMGRSSAWGLIDQGGMFTFTRI